MKKKKFIIFFPQNIFFTGREWVRKRNSKSIGKSNFFSTFWSFFRHTNPFRNHRFPGKKHCMQYFSTERYVFSMWRQEKKNTPTLGHPPPTQVIPPEAKPDFGTQHETSSGEMAHMPKCSYYTIFSM